MSVCNVLHMTTRCNLDCKYCYEKNNRDMPGFKHYDTTEEEVDVFLKQTKEAEPNNISSLVLFGGEPLLNMDLIKYTYKKVKEYPKKSFNINIISNGIRLKDKKFSSEFFELLKNYNDNDISTSLDISYDFQGNGLRVYKDGRDSTPDVLKSINNINEYLLKNPSSFKFRIRPTIQYLNEDKILRNTIYTFEKFKSVSRIIYTYAYNNMEEHFGNDYFNTYIKKYKDYLLEISHMYNKQICFQLELCEECGKCTILSGENKYRYQTPGSKDETHIIEGNVKSFNLFKNLIKPVEKEGCVKVKDLKQSITTLRSIINE